MARVKDVKSNGTTQKFVYKEISNHVRDAWINFDPDNPDTKRFHPDVVLSSPLTRRLFESEDDLTLDDYLEEYVLVNQYIGLQIHSLRIMKMMSLKELSAKLGVSIEACQDYELGQELIPLETIRQALNLFDVDLDCCFANYDLFKLSALPLLETKAIRKARNLRDLNILYDYINRLRECYKIHSEVEKNSNV